MFTNFFQISGGYDGKVICWDKSAWSGEQQVTPALAWTAHSKEVTALAVTANGLLLSGSGDKYVDFRELC